MILEQLADVQALLEACGVVHLPLSTAAALATQSGGRQLLDAIENLVFQDT